MKPRVKPKTTLDQRYDEVVASGYTPISGEHNAMKLLLADLGKADLLPREVEELCKTAKVAGLNGFVRLDFLPCGCERMYRGVIIGFDHNPQSYILRVGGVEGVKPCQRHKPLIDHIRR